MLVSASLLAFSCQKGDGDVDYGNTYIYIPQATVSGGIDNYYNVPSGGAENTYNFVKNGDSVDILLGVLRSGKEAGQAFTVGVQVDAAASSAAAAALGAEVLASSSYSLPSSVSVAAGQNSASFSLQVPQSAIQTGKTYVLAVSLTSPSYYELAKKNTTVVVVIDGSALKALI